MTATATISTDGSRLTVRLPLAGFARVAKASP